MLDWIIGFGHKTAEIHFFGMSARLVSGQNETLLWLVQMNYLKVPTHQKVLHLIAQVGETRIYVLKAELKMDACKTVKEWDYWVLTLLHAS